MIRSFLIYFATTCFLCANVRAGDDSRIAARSAAFDLAGAFSANDGYKLRDGFYTVNIKPGESKIFQVNLYSGDSYWFCVATAPEAKKIGVTLFDENGQPVAIQTFAGGSRAAAGFTASISGAYFVKMTNSSPVDPPDKKSEKETEKKSVTACLLYAYK